MESERKRSDEYWMGVRDALRMVDSFNKWARRNKERAKDLDDFIHDGLIAAAKRCESCLKDDLGLTFIEGEDAKADESVPSGYEATPPSPSEEVSFQQTDDDFTIESVERSEEGVMEDISLDGPSREFTSEFELVEPSPLVVEPPPPEEGEITQSDEETETERKPSFTWADYEKAVTPSKDDQVIEDAPDEVEVDIDSELIEEEETPPIDEENTLGTPTVLTHEEPAIPTDEFEGSFDIDGYDDDVPPPADIDELGEIDSPEPITEPPPPPPPPESDEDEDERRRRARRLFFGD